VLQYDDENPSSPPDSHATAHSSEPWLPGFVILPEKRCAPALLEGVEGVPAEAVHRFPAGLKDYLSREIVSTPPNR
jgi:hypothetical protein